MLCYSMMSDAQLKKHLREWNLPTHGTRAQFEKRHREFTLTYNAECDAVDSRPVSEIIRNILEEERRVDVMAQKQKSFS